MLWSTERCEVTIYGARRDVKSQLNYGARRDVKSQFMVRGVM